MERFFNTAGPNIVSDNYSIPPLSRIDLDEILVLIRQKRYFVLHAPRQTGKTSCLLALRDYLNQQGDYIAVYANVEGGQASRNDKDTVVASTVDAIANETQLILKTQQAEEARQSVKDISTDSKLSIFLSRLCQRLAKPLVLFIDEIDPLVGDSLVSVLRQIRSGYANRPAAFPQTIVLCGVRDMRDYRIVLSNQDIVTGGSVFNIKAESLRLGNFTREEIRELYMQHTRETGQPFAEECLPMVWEATEGQPWLVNTLAHEVTYRMRENRDRSVCITPDMLYRAQERIIYRRDTHIDILIDKLREPRVKRVVLELKLRRGDLDKVVEKGLEQTRHYMDTVGAVDEGHLIVFDRTGEKSWEERIWHKPCDYQGHTIMVWGM